MKKINRMVLVGLVLLLVSACQTSQPLTEYRFGGYFAWVAKNVLNIDIGQDIDPQEIDPIYGQSIQVDQKTCLLRASDTQRDALVARNEEVSAQIEAELKAKLDHFSSQVSADYKEATLYLPSNLFADPEYTLRITGDLYSLIGIWQTNRVLITADDNECIQVKLVNAQSGYQISQACFPYESISCDEKDMQTSEKQDVFVSSKLTDYAYVEMTIEDCNEQMIVLVPSANEQGYYAEDERLAICLDSVYAEDLYLPFDLKKGDQVVVQVNGKYAIHDDKDDIADIAPLCLIPLDYFVG